MFNKPSSYDPSKSVWNNVKIEDWDCSKWKQWKPLHTGSSADYCATADREYLRVKFAVKQSNIELSADKCKIKLKLTSPSAIGLQGTFPCKHGDTGKNDSPNKQYTISLGLPATDAGIKIAKAKARELDLQLITKTFQWTAELLGKQSQKITQIEEKPTKLIGQLIQEYEKEYWKTRERNRQTIHTWDNQYWQHLKALPQNVPLSQDLLIEAIEKTKPNRVNRTYRIWQLKKFCNFHEFDFSKLLDSYSVTKLEYNQKNIPSDQDVIQAFHLIGAPIDRKGNKNIINPEQWQWFFGMMAAYGLRPHELFAIDLEAYCHSSNIYHLVTLDTKKTDGTKTGERNCGIPPIHPEWVELFDLKSIKPYSTNSDLRTKVDIISKKFRKLSLQFLPYDLRHAYAIRGHRLRIPIKAMADYMGHSVQEHTKTYQRWMDRNTNIEIYKEVVIDKQVTTKDEMKALIVDLRAENIDQKAEVAALKAENERLKMLLTEYKLDDLLNR